MWQTVAFAVAILVMLVGVAGTFVPGIPGLPLIWLAMLGYGFAEGFHEIRASFLLTTLAVVLVSLVAEHYAKAWGARHFGAGKAGTWGAVIGSAVGLFFMPVGLFLGPFLGALIGELVAGRPAGEALRAGWGGLVGVLGSVVINVTLGILLTVAFILKVIS